jgi:hypothetical protein
VQRAVSSDQDDAALTAALQRLDPLTRRLRDERPARRAPAGELGLDAGDDVWLHAGSVGVDDEKEITGPPAPADSLPCVSSDRGLHGFGTSVSRPAVMRIGRNAEPVRENY